MASDHIDIAYSPACNDWHTLIHTWIPTLVRDVLKASFTSSNAHNESPTYSARVCGDVKVDEHSDYFSYSADFLVGNVNTGVHEVLRFPKLITDPEHPYRGCWQFGERFVYLPVLQRVAHNVVMYKGGKRPGYQIRSAHPDKIGRSTCTLNYDARHDRYYVTYPYVKVPIPHDVMMDALVRSDTEELQRLLRRTEQAVQMWLREEVLPHLKHNLLEKARCLLQWRQSQRSAQPANLCDMRYAEFESAALQCTQLVRQQLQVQTKLLARALMRHAKAGGGRISIEYARHITTFPSLSRRVATALNTGRWEFRRGVTHQLITFNRAKVAMQLRRVSSPYLSQKNKKITEPRMLDAADRTDSTFGFLCAINSGAAENCGLSLELACTTRLDGLRLTRPVRVRATQTVAHIAHNEPFKAELYEEVVQAPHLGLAAIDRLYGLHDHGARGLFASTMEGQFITADNMAGAESKTQFRADYAQRTGAPFDGADQVQAVVAILPFDTGACNEEDACCVSQQWVQFGAMSGSVTTTVRVPPDAKKPPLGWRDPAGPRKRTAAGEVVRGGEVLLPDVKLRPEQHGILVEQRPDRFRVRTRIPLAEGDKISTLSGQKSVVARVVPREDLPFVERTGMTPDIVVHPAALVSRMTCGYLLNMLRGKAAATLGGDNVPLTAQNCDAIMRECGFAPTGCEWMRDGVTGERFQAPTFIGLLSYGRMQQLASLKANVHATGPRDPVTQQPVAGRINDGGPKAGNMEIDGFFAQGAAYLTRERTCELSDRITQVWCKTCSMEVPRPQRGCPGCKQRSSLRRVDLPAGTMVFAAELAANGVQMQCILRDEQPLV